MEQKGVYTPKEIYQLMLDDAGQTPARDQVRRFGLRDVGHLKRVVLNVMIEHQDEKGFDRMPRFNIKRTRTESTRRSTRGHGIKLSAKRLRRLGAGQISKWNIVGNEGVIVLYPQTANFGIYAVPYEAWQKLRTSVDDGGQTLEITEQVQRLFAYGKEGI